MTQSIWTTANFNNNIFILLDLDHPKIEKEILNEIKSGVDVYYDRRWDITQEFCEFLYEIPELFQYKDVLIIGAGIGAESVVIGSMAKKIYINDLAPVALEYCATQLKKNDINNFEILPGNYESLAIPPVDLTVACFCVYNRESKQSMKSFIKKRNSPLLIVNDALPDFKKLLKDTKGGKKYLVPEERFPCYLFG